MDRMKAIFVAGGLTGLVLITMLVLGVRRGTPAETVSAGTNPAQVLGISSSAIAPAQVEEAEVQTLLEQNQQLRGAVEMMQQREAQYQAQLESANQTIQTLQSQVAPQSAPGYEDDEDEYERDEHDEHEREHEAGEDDDD
jgi:TolA-binding protein